MNRSRNVRLTNWQGQKSEAQLRRNLLVENGNGLIENIGVFEADGTAERDAALVMREQIPGTKQLIGGGKHTTQRISWPSAET